MMKHPQQRVQGKRWSVWLSVIALLVMLLPTASLTAYAAKTYSFDMERQKNIEIVILYDGTAPTVSVKGPSATYSKDADYAKVEKQTGRLYLYLKDAAAGHWTITANKDIDYTVLVWQETISVSSFVQEQPKNDKIKVKALVESDSEQRYRWYIYAVGDAAITGTEQKRLLTETNGTTNKESTAEVSIKDLPDGQWTLTTEAVVDYGDGLTAEARAAAQPFTVTGHTQQGDAAKIVTRTDLSAQTMYVDWQAVEDDYDAMLVSAVDANGELLLYETFDKRVTATDFLSEGTVTLRLMPLKRENFQTMYTLNLSYTPSVTVTIDTPETTGDLMVQISYQTPDDRAVPATVTVNDKSGQYRFSGAGTLSLPLSPMDNNTVSVTYSVSDTEQYTVSKTIHVQSAPVFIEFYGVDDQLVTDKDTVLIAGKTEPGVALKLNDTAVTVEDNGEFTAEAALTKGENVLSFAAEGSYGTRTERTVRVIRTTAGSSAAAAMNHTEIAPWLYWVFGGGMLLLTVAAIFLTIRLIRKRQCRPLAAVLLSLRMFLLLTAVLMTAAGGFCLYEYLHVSNAVSGEQLIDRLAGSDYDGLDQVLQVREAWFGRMILLFVLAAVVAAVFVLLTVLDNKHRQGSSNGKSPKPPKPKKSGKIKPFHTPTTDRPQFIPGQTFPPDNQ